MPKGSLFGMSGDSRHTWKHAIRAEDINTRRLAMTFRELTPEFLTGASEGLGQEIFNIAYRFSGDVVGSSAKISYPARADIY